MTKVDLHELDAKINSLTNTWRKLPVEVAAIAVNFSKERFRQQNWLDNSPELWMPRSVRRAGGPKRSQTLLIDSGRLMRSVRKISANESLIVIGTDVPYAALHNDGGTIRQTVSVKSFVKKSYIRKAHTRTGRSGTQSIAAHPVASHVVGSHMRRMNLTIPARRFLGASEELTRRVVSHIERSFEEALK